jgi:membrane-associated phospholipid phosphatase
VAQVQASQRPARSARSGLAGHAPLWLGAGLAAFVALAVLVERGALTHVDQFAVDHLMPWLHPGASSGGGVAGLVLPFRGGTNGWCVFLDLWNYPCSVLVSGLGVGLAAAACLRRDRPGAAAAIAACWLAGNAVELIGKHVIVRPTLYAELDGSRIPIAAFDQSFPSGHMIRGIVLAAALTVALPRARRAVLVWLLPVAPFLVVSDAHTVSDVLGGLIAGAVLAGAAGMLVRSPSLERFVRERLEGRRQQATAR